MDWQDKCFSWRDRLSASRKEKAFNDVKFIVKGRVMRANSWILGMTSPVMFALFFGPLADKNKKPVYINDEMGTTRGFEEMMNFVYKEDKYDIADLLGGKERISKSEELEKLMELLFFGDKYQMKSLIALCRNMLIKNIKFTRENVTKLYEVIHKYSLFTVEFQIFMTQMRAYQYKVVDVDIFPWVSNIGNKSMSCQEVNPQISYQIKFKVNQNVLYHFDANDHSEMNYDPGSTSFGASHHTSHYMGISWEPKNGRSETEGGKHSNGLYRVCKFHAEANTEITLNFLMHEWAATYDLGDWDCDMLSSDDLALASSAIFHAEDLECEIIEVNGKSFKEAIASNEHFPISKLNFQRMGWDA